MRAARALLLWLALGACAPAPQEAFELPLRNPTVPIGAISRFDLGAFAGDWQVRESAGGAWILTRFSVDADSMDWREVCGAGPAHGRINLRAPGILRVTYEDGVQRDIWVVWIDPDHRTAALGTPEGDFGFVVTRTDSVRRDQVTAARQVLDFNGYRTDTWNKVQ
ncbi:lipocalin family protein [uncultured Tateyamaria sp.]|uniref:lipocalin family protein n=1 Tax=uncultured Tateyamaria sp. TaxID=455651 RepID=UPI00261409FE|nr:lipocalin family protein [uncultured Tateyamaria sp.]